MLTRGDDRGDDECRHRRDATEAERENRQVSHPARAVGAAGLISQNSNEAHRQQPTRGNQRREKSGIKNRCDHTDCVPKFREFYAAASRAVSVADLARAAYRISMSVASGILHA